MLTRQQIAEQAEEAARSWCANPKMPKPANPFPSDQQPQHQQFKADFERYLLLHSTGEISA